MSVLNDLFLDPGAALWLLIPMAAWLGLRAARVLRHRRLQRVAGERASRIVDGSIERVRGHRRRLSCVVLALLALALMQPTWGVGDGADRVRGLDVVLVLDVSRSMNARDVAPDRLSRAKEEVRRLADAAVTDRLALVIFAGEAKLAVPLTRDHGALLAVLESADPLSVRLGGTDLGAAIRTAHQALGEASDGRSAIVLLTDGEDPEGTGREAAEAAAKDGHRTYAVGFGTAGGAAIPVKTESGEERLREGSGREVITRLVPDDLRRLAEAGGGSYDSTEGSSEPLAEVYRRRLRPLARAARLEAARAARPNRFQWPLLAAVLLWILQSCLVARSTSRS